MILLEKMKEWLAGHTCSSDTYPEFMVKRMYTEVLIFIGCILCFISFFIVRLTALFPLLLLLILICIIDFLRCFYVCLFGKWKYLEGVCLTDTSKFQLGSRKKVQFMVKEGESKGIYSFTTSRKDFFTKGCTIGIYTQNVDFLEVNGVYQLPLLYRIEIM